MGIEKTDPERMGEVLAVIIEVVRQVAILVQPVMPDAASNLLDQLKIPQTERDFTRVGGNIRLAAGTVIDKPQPVFPRFVDASDKEQLMSDMLHIIDSHAHLDYPQFEAQLDDVIGRAASLGVREMITIGVKLSTAQNAAENLPKNMTISGLVQVSTRMRLAMKLMLPTMRLSETLWITRAVLLWVRQG